VSSILLYSEALIKNYFYLDNDMAGRHRSRNKSIQIIRTATVPAKQCKRVSVLQFHVSIFKNIKNICFHSNLLLLIFIVELED